MPEVLPRVDDAANLVSPPAPRAALFFDGANWRVARVSATGYLEIDVLTSALPAGAATAAAQALALAQLQLIEDMRDALQSVATDRLIVRGEDQLFSYNRPVSDCKLSAISGAGGWCNSESPPDGRVWVIKTIVALDVTSPTTEHQGTLIAAVGSGRMFTERFAFAANDWSSWTGHVYLEHDDVIQVRFIGALVNDNCRVCITGYEMIKET